VLDDRVRENIAFLTPLGDGVDNADDQEQWDNALSALDPLFCAPRSFPYSICHGNRDGVDLSTLYLGPERYEHDPWYIGASPNGLYHAQVFHVQQRTFLHLNIEKFPGEEAYSWAQSVLDNPQYHGLPTGLSAHDYVVCGGRGPVGDDITENLVRKNPQIFMTLNGHTHFEYHFAAHDDANQPVFQMLSDYQDRDDGGEGLMRLLRIDEAAGTIGVKTFSPASAIEDDDEIITVDPFFEEDEDSQFVLSTNSASASIRAAPTTSAPSRSCRRSRPPLRSRCRPPTSFNSASTGTRAYLDTPMNENNPDLDSAGEMTLTTDMDDNGSNVNGLLGYMDIIGGGADPIPPGSILLSAKRLFHMSSATDGQGTRSSPSPLPWLLG
jgi:hypothetical protein